MEEITEIGIGTILIGKVKHTPCGTTAKWFRDELGQLWVKFDSSRPGNRGAPDYYEHWVFPAHLVRGVRYLKKGQRP